MAPSKRKKEKSMSSKPNRNGSREADVISAQGPPREVQVGNSAFDEEIRTTGSRLNVNSKAGSFDASSSHGQVLPFLIPL
jgi:hypothetical protein